MRLFNCYHFLVRFSNSNNPSRNKLMMKNILKNTLSRHSRNTQFRTLPPNKKAKTTKDIMISKKSRTRLARVAVIVALLISITAPFWRGSVSQAVNSSQGPRTATASGDCTNDASAGVLAWKTPGNAYSSAYAHTQSLVFKSNKSFRNQSRPHTISLLRAGIRNTCCNFLLRVVY